MKRNNSKNENVENENYYAKNDRDIEEINSTTVIEPKDKIDEDGEDDDKDDPSMYIFFFIISIICSIIIPAPFTACIPIIIIVTAKAKFPNSTPVKVLFWLTIVYIIIGLILTCILFATCINSCKGLG